MKKSWDIWEIIAIEYLKKNWYQLLDTNFKFSIFWEIDLILKKDDLTIFVEVKYRKNDKFWTGEESISSSKLAKLEKTVYYYAFWHHIDIEKIRFDIISITRWEKSYTLIHYKNQAFQKK